MLNKKLILKSRKNNKNIKNEIFSPQTLLYIYNIYTMRRDQITSLKSYTNVTPLNIVLLDAYFSNLTVGL